LALGEGIRKICKDKDMPSPSTVYLWLLDPKHEVFSEQYALARNAQAEHLFEELLEIADHSAGVIQGVDRSDGARVQAEKLRVDTRKWYLSKVVPKKYGDKLDLTSGGKEIKGNTIVLKKFDGTRSE
jgi:hypothetical protein